MEIISNKNVVVTQQFNNSLNESKYNYETFNDIDDELKNDINICIKSINNNILQSIILDDINRNTQNLINQYVYNEQILFNLYDKGKISQQELNDRLNVIKNDLSKSEIDFLNTLINNYVGDENDDGLIKKLSNAEKKSKDDMSQVIEDKIIKMFKENVLSFKLEKVVNFTTIGLKFSLLYNHNNSQDVLSEQQIDLKLI